MPNFRSNKICLQVASLYLGMLINECGDFPLNPLELNY